MKATKHEIDLLDNICNTYCGITYQEYIQYRTQGRYYRNLKIKIIGEFRKKGYTYNRIGLLLGGLDYSSILYYNRVYNATD